MLHFLPWVARVWAFPRKRGAANLTKTLPFIRALQREQFDRSVDFAGNDRGAILTLLCGAQQRLGHLWPGGFLGRRFCYTQTVQAVEGQHQTLGDLLLLSAWGITAPEHPKIEIAADPARTPLAASLLPRQAVICHLSAGKPRNEWPVSQWAEFYRLASSAGHEVVFSTGTLPREQALLEDLKRLAPGVSTLPRVPDLATFIAVIGLARLFVGGDTGPLHFAAGLGVPTVALFGASAAKRWDVFAGQYSTLQGGLCDCDERCGVCSSAKPCMAGISPETVLEAVSKSLRQRTNILA